MEKVDTNYQYDKEGTFSMISTGSLRHNVLFFCLTLHGFLNFGEYQCLKEFTITYWNYFGDATLVRFISLALFRNKPKLQFVMWQHVQG